MSKKKSRPGLWASCGVAFAAFGLAAKAFATEPPLDTSCEDQNAWGFLDTHGKVVVAPQFKEVRAFSEKLAAVRLQSGKWGYLGLNGQLAIPAQYDLAADFQDGLAAILVGKSWAYIDQKGAIKIDGVSECHDFNDEIGLYKRDGKFGYYDRAGTMIYQVKDDGSYEEMRFGLAPFYITGKPEDTGGFITRAGKRVTIRHTGGVQPASEGLAAFSLRAGPDSYRMGYVDQNGSIVIAAKYEEASQFSEGLASVVSEDHLGFIDKSGKTKIPLRYLPDPMMVATPYRLQNGPMFHQDRAIVFAKGKSLDEPKAFYLDKKGKIAIDLSAKKSKLVGAYDFNDGLALTEWSNNRQVFIDLAGKDVLDVSRFDRVKDFSNGRAAVCLKAAGKGKR